MVRALRNKQDKIGKWTRTRSLFIFLRRTKGVMFISAQGSKRKRTAMSRPFGAMWLVMRRGKIRTFFLDAGLSMNSNTF